MLNKNLVIVFLLLCSKAAAQKNMNDSSWRRSYDSGYYYLNRFMPPQSILHFKEAVLKSSGLSRWHYASSLFGAGQATWYAGNFKNAADTVELAIHQFAPERKEDLANALRVLSNIYDDMGDFEKAFINIQH